MRKTPFLLLLLCLFGLPGYSFSQGKVKMNIVFVDGEMEGKYFASVMVESGEFKPGDLFTATCEGGATFQFKLASISGSEGDVEKAVVSNEQWYFNLETLNGQQAKGFNERCTLVPGTTAAPAPVATPNENASWAELTCNLNGKAWKGASFYNSCLFYAKGNSMANSKDTPLLMLAFQSAQSPDTRQFTVLIKGFTPKVGPVDFKLVEAVLSGTENGDEKQIYMQSNYERGQADMPRTPFQFDIVSWKMVSAEEAVATIRISGKLTGMKIFGVNEPDCEMTNGIITDVHIKVFNEAY